MDSVQQKSCCSRHTLEDVSLTSSLVTSTNAKEAHQCISCPAHIGQKMRIIRLYFRIQAIQICSQSPLHFIFILSYCEEGDEIEYAT